MGARFAVESALCNVTEKGDRRVIDAVGALTEDPSTEVSRSAARVLRRIVNEDNPNERRALVDRLMAWGHVHVVATAPAVGNHSSRRLLVILLLLILPKVLLLLVLLSQLVLVRLLS